MSSQETDAGGDRAEGGASVPRWLAVVSVVVLVAGLVILGVFGWRYLEARESQSVATERDEVTDVASQVIINAFSFDHRNVDESLEHLASVSTGDFRAEQDQWAEDVRTRVVEQQAVTTATVSHTAVTTLDTDADEDAVLVVFTAHSEREGEEDITGRQAMRVDLVREDGQWKAGAVDQVGVTVPVGESSESVQGLDGSVLPEDGATEEDPTGDGADSADEDATDQTESEESTPSPTTSGGR